MRLLFLLLTCLFSFPSQGQEGQQKLSPLPAKMVDMIRRESPLPVTRAFQLTVFYFLNPFLPNPFSHNNHTRIWYLYNI